MSVLLGNARKLRRILTTSQLLRESTRPQHEEIENTSFVTQLMKGELDTEAYTKYLNSLAWVYETLEAKIAQGIDLAGSQTIFDPRLNRIESISKDLKNLGVSDWKAANPSNVIKDYMTHINSLSDHKLIAHHYIRYLGDLSGGQAIAALVKRHYGITEEQLSFYRFDEIEDIVRFKESYREALDNLDLSENQLTELVEEAKLAFRYNQRVFEDLEQS
jgi:heme oxygenase